MASANFLGFLVGNVVLYAADSVLGMPWRRIVAELRTGKTHKRCGNETTQNAYCLLLLCHRVNPSCKEHLSTRTVRKRRIRAFASAGLTQLYGIYGCDPIVLETARIDRVTLAMGRLVHDGEGPYEYET